jgi:hypothetical protein
MLARTLARFQGMHVRLPLIPIGLGRADADIHEARFVAKGVGHGTCKYEAEVLSFKN